jgi:hypothetical protein
VTEPVALSSLWTGRLLAVGAVYHGARQTKAAKIGGVTLQILRDWALKLNASTLPCRHPEINRRALGIDEEYPRETPRQGRLLST